MSNHRWKGPSIKLVLILILSLFSLVGCNEHNELREYVPIISINDKGLVDAPDLLTEEHINNLEHVLMHYDVKYTRISEKLILIDTSVGLELQWNFTSKANDKQWLNSHPFDNNNL